MHRPINLHRFVGYEITHLLASVILVVYSSVYQMLKPSSGDVFPIPSKTGPKMADLWKMKVESLNVSFAIQKRHIFCVKIGADVLAVGDWKNQKTKNSRIN